MTGEPNLLVVCVAAFIAVVFLLTLFAGVIRLLMALFPDRVEIGDDALIAAIHSAAARAFPGTKITKIEETR